MSAPFEVSNKLGLDNVPNFLEIEIGLATATPSHESDFRAKGKQRDDNMVASGSQEIYDFETSSIIAEEGSPPVGQTSGYDREYWRPDLPPKAVEFPTKPRARQASSSTPNRNIAHISHLSPSNASTRVESPAVFTIAINKPSPRNSFSIEPFQSQDPHRAQWPSRQKSSSTSTKWWKGKVSFPVGCPRATFKWVLLQIYKHMLLRVPSMYHTRVCQLFADADVSKPDIEQLIKNFDKGETYAEDWSPSSATPGLKRFKHNWEAFVDQVMQEWKTLNVVSALLLSAILTMFQIDGAVSQPVVHITSLLSLMFTIWSLIFGCSYIFRFASLRSVSRATPWVQESRDSEAFILWNVWVLLALPAVWLAWSVIAFLIAIMAFVWTTGSSLRASSPSPQPQDWASRTAVTAVFVLGVLYFFLVVHTFSNYGSLHEVRPELEDLGEGGQTNLNSMPGRAIATPPNRTFSLAPDVLLATPDGSSKYSNLSSVMGSPRSPELLLMSPRDLERGGMDQQQCGTISYN